MKLKICLLALLWPAINAFAQNSPPTIAPLKIGDKVPDIVLNNLINYPVSKIQLSQLKRKLTILDFWTTWCGACIQEFPKLDTIQKHFKDSLIVLGVAYEQPEKIKSFLAKNRYARYISFPIVSNDSVLSSLFPHHSLPHEVWIDSNLTVYKITAASYITTHNINFYMKAQPFNPIIKIDLEGYNKEQPLSTNYNPGIEQKVLYRSALYGYLGAGSSAGYFRDTINGKLTLRFTDCPIINLYQRAILPKDFGSGFRKRIILKVKDPGRYLYVDQQYAEWSYHNTYSYELTTDAGISDTTAKGWMVDDLNRYLQLEGKIESQRVQCLVVKKVSANRPPGTVEEKIDLDQHAINFKNIPFKKLIAALNDYTETSPNLPVVNESGFAGNIDINITVKKSCPTAELKSMLLAFGIETEEQERDIKVFVLTEK